MGGPVKDLFTMTRLGEYIVCLQTNKCAALFPEAAAAKPCLRECVAA